MKDVDHLKDRGKNVIKIKPNFFIHQRRRYLHFGITWQPEAHYRKEKQARIAYAMTESGNLGHSYHSIYTQSNTKNIYKDDMKIYNDNMMRDDT